MAVMLFDHARIGMPKILGDYKKGYAVHRGQTCPSVTQCMKVDRGLDFCPPACPGYRPQLMTLAPRRAIGFEEHWLASRAVKANLLKEGCAVICQDDMARLAGLADANRDGAIVSVEVIHSQPNELAITRTRFQRGTHQISKGGVATVKKTLAFDNREIAHAGGISSLEWLDLPPFLVLRRFAFAPSQVERSLQLGKTSIC
jgi:hypothetical protein